MGADRVNQFRRKGELKLPLIPVVRNLIELRGYGFYVEILAPFRALQQLEIRINIPVTKPSRIQLPIALIQLLKSMVFRNIYFRELFGETSVRPNVSLQLDRA